jgi:hypothetical protein
MPGRRRSSLSCRCLVVDETLEGRCEAGCRCGLDANRARRTTSQQSPARTAWQQRPTATIRARGGAVVSEDGSTGVMPDVRLVHGYREAAVAGDLEETTQGVEFSNACRWMKHMSAHRAEQVGRQSGFSGSTPKQKPGRLRTAASNSITSMSAASYEQSVTTTRYRPGGPL